MPEFQSRLNDLLDEFELFDDWEERYRYIIDLGKDLAPLKAEEKTAATKVLGCASQVWLVMDAAPDGILRFRGESDAFIVKGLIAILFATYSDKPARDILATDAIAMFERLGLRDHLTPQRSNGFRSMVERIRRDAAAALAAA